MIPDEIRNQLTCNLFFQLPISTPKTCNNMAESESYNIETAVCIETTIKYIIEKIINEIEYENMRTELSLFDNIMKRTEPLGT